MISIIIPAYQAEATIGKAVAAVQSQTVADWELIVVDDGSTDNTGMILDQLAAEDTRIRPVHITNGGAFRARLRGVDEARGEWVAFMDADDSMPTDAMERMLGVVDSAPKADIYCGTLEFRGAVRRQGMVYRHRVSGHLSAEEYQNAMLLGQTSIGNYAKLIRVDVFKAALSQTTIERFLQNEDMLLLMILSNHCHNGIYVAPDEVVYTYVRRRGSISASVLPVTTWLRLFQSVEASLLIKDSDEFTRYKLNVLMELCILIGADFSGAQKELQEITTRAKRLPYLTKKEKITVAALHNRALRYVLSKGFLTARFFKRLIWK